MSVVTVGFLVLMVLIGGVVALLADNLGRKIGKKRLKIHHKIRPRHTATLFVVGSGLLIPIVTVGLVSFLSKDVRTWLVEGEQAITDVKQLRPEVENLKKQKATLDEEFKRQKVANDLIVKTGNAKLAQLNKEVQEKTRQRLELQTKLTGAQARLAKASSVLENATSKLQAALSSTTIAEGNKVKAIRDFKEALKQRDDAYSKMNELNRNIDANDKTIKEQLTQIATLSKSMNDAQKEFDQKTQSLQNDLTAKQKQLDDIKKDLQDGEAELKRVTDAIGSLLAVNETTRKRRMIYGIGDEVARLVVSEDLTTSQARNQLNSLLRSARVSAEANGAKGSGRVGAAGIFDQEINGTVVSADQQMSQIVARIAGIPQSRILVASTLWNSYAGEPVPLDVMSFPNTLSFHSGDVISEVKIDGDLSSGKVLAMLSNWLSTEVKQAALKAGMVPAAGRPDALASVAPEDVFDLVAQIKSQSRVARVQALAFEDTYAAGPLKLTFRIR